METLWAITAAVIPAALGLGGLLLMLASSTYGIPGRLCFVLSAVWLGVVGLMWLLKTPTPFAYRLLAGLGIGAAVFVVIPEFVRLKWPADQATAESLTSPGQNMTNSNDSRPTINVTGSGNVVTSGQTGGTNIGTYINQAKAELKVLSDREQVSQDGTYTATIDVGIEAPFSPGKLTIQVQADGLLGVDVFPPAVGGVVTMEKRNVRKGPNFYSADIPSPGNQYEIIVRTKTKTPIGLGYSF